MQEHKTVQLQLPNIYRPVTSSIEIPKHHSEKRGYELLSFWFEFKGDHSTLVMQILGRLFMNECGFRACVIYMPLASTVGLLSAQKYKLQAVYQQQLSQNNDVVKK